MKNYVILLSLFCTFNSYADEMVFSCPEVVYIDSVVLEHNQPLPFNIELDTSTKPKFHLININLYNNNMPIKPQKNDGKNYFWSDLNGYHQGLNEWIYFACQYENGIKLSKKVLYVSECKARTTLANNKKYLKSAEFNCD